MIHVKHIQHLCGAICCFFKLLISLIANGLHFVSLRLLNLKIYDFLCATLFCMISKVLKLVSVDYTNSLCKRLINNFLSSQTQQNSFSSFVLTGAILFRSIARHCRYSSKSSGKWRSNEISCN